MASKNAQLLSAIKQAAVSFQSPSQYDTILQSIGDARVVMIGEASHGTHEFYHHRAELTKKLITEKGFDMVCVEGDWPDAYQINRYVKAGTAINGINSAADAFAGFKRFPTWMWRNNVTVDFAQWLRNYNSNKKSDPSKVGFYGLDLYSLHQSAQSVIEYLNKVDPDAAKRARSRYSCFDHYGDDPQSYGMAAAFGMTASCEQGAIKMLSEMQAREAEAMQGESSAMDKEFYALMNAVVVRDAEEYYRGMFLRKNTWNIRDNHMVKTLGQLMDHVSAARKMESSAASQAEKEKPVKAVVWAHNSHLGDARFTEFADRGEENVGQLCRQKFGRESTYNVGFTTYTGTVTAAHEWDDPAQTMQVRPALSDTYEDLFHQVGGDFVLRFRANKSSNSALSPEERNVVQSLATGRMLLERAIGVIYRPKTERQSHLFQAQIAEQFDSVIHIDHTSALKEVNDEYLRKK